ncbi:hypothetical protein SAMN05880582_101649 [Rhizobium sp. RU20A]|uniref:hypothetical protein n=1 Tax=Rhizobium sp. RU20A TaxID=1907412 RepID=UPI000955E88B|nr:hypothetical protein [Rhizobium sp. RU20A]SIQ08006.1 hypothetical protein SAMN05880582_101649 [Rhizobium sp. RU20A]
MRKTLLSAAALAAAFITSMTAAKAEDLVFKIVNNTPGTLERFYSSPVGVDDWEEDIFGDKVVAPGETMEITIADGRSVCKYDMRFEFTEDSKIEDLEDSQDLCELGTYTISLH